MTSYVFDFMPLFTGGILALSLLFKIYKRSIATFIIILSQMIVVNLMMYGYIHEALLAMIVTTIILLIRAMAKSDTDKFFSIEANKKDKDKI